MTSSTRPTVTTLQEDQLFYEGFKGVEVQQDGFSPNYDSPPLRTFTGSGIMRNIQPLQLVALLMTVGRRTDSLNEKMQALVEQNKAMKEIMQDLLDTSKDAKQAAKDSVTQAHVDLDAGMRLLAGAMEKMTTSLNASIYFALSPYALTLPSARPAMTSGPDAKPSDACEIAVRSGTDEAIAESDHAIAHNGSMTSLIRNFVFILLSLERAHGRQACAKRAVFASMVKEGILAPIDGETFDEMLQEARARGLIAIEDRDDERAQIWWSIE